MDFNEFHTILSTASDDELLALDDQLCGCRYVYHWVKNMNMGTWNPMLTEMDVDLRGVHTVEQLWEFVQSNMK